MDNDIQDRQNESIETRLEQIAEELPASLKEKRRKTLQVLICVGVAVLIFAVALIETNTHKEDENPAVESAITEEPTFPADIKRTFDYSSQSLPLDLTNGDTISNLGGYEWLVLDVRLGKATIITKSVIDFRAYNEEYIDTTWETSTIRKWLNGDFYDNTFTETEKEAIVESKISNPENPQFGTDGGNDTVDNVFLLSIDEAQTYFGSNAERTAIFFFHMTGVQDADAPLEWWLRSPGQFANSAASVNPAGKIVMSGRGVDGYSGGIRPVLQIKI